MFQGGGGGGGGVIRARDGAMSSRTRGGPVGERAGAGGSGRRKGGGAGRWLSMGCIDFGCTVWKRPMDG